MFQNILSKEQHGFTFTWLMFYPYLLRNLWIIQQSWQFSVLFLLYLFQGKVPQVWVPLTYLDEDVGSVICLCIRACLIRCSFSAFCTSAGISGEVWLIFSAASSTLVVAFPFSLTSFFSLFSKTSVGALELLCGTLLALEVRGLLLQQGQHSFQKTKSETTSKASPQKLTTTAKRLTETSARN